MAPRGAGEHAGLLRHPGSCWCRGRSSTPVGTVTCDGVTAGGNRPGGRTDQRFRQARGRGGGGRLVGRAARPGVLRADRRDRPGGGTDGPGDGGGPHGRARRPGGPGGPARRGDGSARVPHHPGHELPGAVRDGGRAAGAGAGVPGRGVRAARRRAPGAAGGAGARQARPPADGGRADAAGARRRRHDAGRVGCGPAGDGRRPRRGRPGDRGRGRDRRHRCDAVGAAAGAGHDDGCAVGAERARAGGAAAAAPDPPGA